MQLTEDIIAKVFEALARPRWKAADPTLMAMLANRDSEQNRRVVRWGMWAAVLSYMGYGILDHYLLPDVARNLILARLTIGTLFLLLLELCIWRGAALGTLHAVAASAIVIGSVGWLEVALGTSHQVALSYFMIFGTVFILGANLFFNFRLWLSALSSSTVAACFVASTIFCLKIAILIKLVLATFFINSLLLSLYLSWRLSKERYQTFLHALRAQVQEKVAIEKGQQLVEIANTDPLTGLKNRRAITRAYMDLRKEAVANNFQIGVILMDVDYFKRFNDELGHHAGDNCLIKLARSFADTAMKFNGVAGRYGGEEFVVLCRVSEVDQLEDISRRFCQTVEALKIRHPNRDDTLDLVTVSVGASMTRSSASMELNALLQEADRALYASKFAGRARSTIYDRSIDQGRSGQNLAQLLKVAIGKQLVSLVYQPIYDVASGGVLGHETLMRLRDFDGSSISPGVFIPVAERTGEIVELGTWAIDRACRDMVQTGLGSIVTVNVSAVQLKAPNFPLRIAEALGRHALSAHKLALEITEGIDIFPETQVLKNIDQLRNLGVQVWLDDFGTGFAGLAWLRRVEFDLVKIDRSFLHDCHAAQGLTMLQDMVQLLRNLGHKVLVEGVETEEQQRLLQQLGVNFMQGFLMGRPVPIDEVNEKRRWPSAVAATA